MRAFIKFNKSMMNMPTPWQLWLMLLVATNMILPLFYLTRLEAQVVLAAILISMALMTMLTARTGFTRLLGLGHIFWFPMLYFLWTRLDQIPAGDLYGLWIRSLIAVNAVSLAIDVADVARYIAGHREETVKGI